ncbi:MAG: histidine kinase [Lachnospiraceae bacterium]|nr:histidine kinase [Lachnospiraceae bacterium]
MVDIEWIGISMEILMMAILSVILFSSIHIRTTFPRQLGVVFLFLIGAVLLELFSDVLNTSILLEGQGNLDVTDIRWIVSSIMIYVSYYAVLFLFFLFVYLTIYDRIEIPKGYINVVFILSMFAVILWIVSAVTNRFVITYYPDESYTPGPFYMPITLIGYTVGGIILFMSIRYRKSVDRSDLFWIFIVSLSPEIVALARFIWDIETNIMPTTLGFSAFCIYNYIVIRQEKKLVEQQIRIREDRVRLMVSQIRPHFIFNMLNNIYVLCEQDPMKAQNAVGEFADYLRANLDAASGTELITGTREMEHVTHYLRLEKIRFGDDIQIESDIETEDFSIPPMTLQPIVENAIKHGICMKENGGTIRIHTQKEKDGKTVITIEDDGVGFDVEAAKERILADERSHVGIANVRERLQIMCHGSMKVESTPGVGTCVIISLPG